MIIVSYSKLFGYGTQHFTFMYLWVRKTIKHWIDKNGTMIIQTETKEFDNLSQKYYTLPEIRNENSWQIVEVIVLHQFEKLIRKELIQSFVLLLGNEIL